MEQNVAVGKRASSLRWWDRRSEAWNKRSTVPTKNQMLQVIPEKREKGDGGYVYCIYTYVRVV
jgi:hypothetical protein